MARQWENMALSREEINRKLLHIVSGSLIPLGIFYLPWIEGIKRWVPAGILGGILVVFLAVEFARLRWPSMQRLFYAVAGHSLRSEESQRLTGATYIFASAFLCSVVFMHRPDIAFMVLSMFVLGDAVAALVGQAWGRIRIGKKSLEGSLGCFLLCLGLFYLAFPFVPGLLDAWGGHMPLAIALFASLATTLLELFPIRLPGRVVLNDNLTVPVATGVLMLWLYPLVNTSG